ncbi:hypothetical protein EWM64_g10794, partial [Hericium alpestre]
MSAGALQSAIDTLYKDEHVIITTESQWYDNLQAKIRHADATPKSEAPYYAPLNYILETYAATCGHPDLVVTVTPQGRFEAMMDFSPQVKRQASDFSLTVVLKKPNNPVDGKGRLAGWVEAKPRDRVYMKNVNTDQNASVNADPGNPGDICGQGEVEGAEADDAEKEAYTDDEGEDDTGGEVEEMNTEGKVEHVNTEGEVEGEDSEGEVEDLDSEDEAEELDAPEDEEMDAEDRAERTDQGEESPEAGHVDEANPANASEPDREDKAEKVHAKKAPFPMNTTQQLVANLPQLCKQAHYAFDHFAEDVIHAMVTYGMGFSFFRFTRPANWDSIRGTEDYTLPEPVFSDEDILIDGRLNPHFKQALHLLTASLGLSYQPSWFQLPSGYHSSPPDLTVAEDALKQYETKIGEELASPPMKTPPSKVKISNYKPTAKEAAAPVKKLRPKLRSGTGGHVTPKAGEEPAENEATEASEPARE